MIAAYEHYGLEVPGNLIPPELHDVELWFWEAFWELSTERQRGMSEGQIPWSAIKRYVDARPVFDFDVVSQIVRTLDGIYLSRDDDATKQRNKGRRGGR
ncbi:hypothetical protein IMZ29_00745 [Achromobacter sp. GG226]|uniref:phage tail assembly chaperone n=1 Tax=Verticiella alkaliphila TaxID=2779529 RepID=UPI001C0CAD73|nr:hypothetical protein [Verticiella sp. GG226]MBU4609130.1 hypothetical protein [Verticiella sp. GG226]